MPTMPPLFAYWVHTPHPFLIRFTDEFGIRYYGLGYLFGFFAAAWLLIRYARAGRSQLPADKVPDLIMATVFGVMIGGRLGYYLLYDPAGLFDPPWRLLQVWKGGMASHGGFIGVTLALAWFARSQKISFLHLGDLITSAAPVGLLLVRITNFLNGELWGKPTGVAWGVIFEQTGGGAQPRHPSQLYEAALEGALLLAYMQWRFWRGDVVQRQPGRLSGEFLIGYALVRMVGEIFREPDASLILGLSRGTFYSAFLIIAGGLLVARSARAVSAKV